MAFVVVGLTGIGNIARPLGSRDSASVDNLWDRGEPVFRMKNFLESGERVHLAVWRVDLDDVCRRVRKSVQTRNPQGCVRRIITRR